MSSNPTNRFSSRVEHYIRSRPGYPPEFYAFLESELLPHPATIADIGSGTGLSAAPLLAAGHTVHCVEPNAPMRQAAEKILGHHPNFHSLPAPAESTTLPDRSVDLILAAQAFHWFDKTKARAEFARILKPGGHIVLVWNQRRLDSTPFLRDYENLLQTYGTDYNQVRHENVDANAIAQFFTPAIPQTRSFYNAQDFDYPSLEARLLSSSYTPAAHEPQHAEMLRKLRKIFDQHQQGGLVGFEYDTTAHFATPGHHATPPPR